MLSDTATNFLAALLGAFVLAFPLRKLAKVAGILDLPDERKIHKTPTPLLGGAAILLGILLLILLGTAVWLRRIDMSL